MIDTLQFIYEKFGLKHPGCKCGHLPTDHAHEVLGCLVCENCQRYKSQNPLDIPNFGRNQLPTLFAELGFTRGAEVGVKRGEYSEVICKANPDGNLYLIDPYVCYDGLFETDQKQMEQNRARARSRVKGYDCEFIRKPSVEAAQMFADDSLDWVYIDANHAFEYVVADLAAWSRVVRPGGLICGHDYIQGGMGPTTFGRANKTFHVKEAVEAFTRAYWVDPWMALGRKEYVAGEIRDSIRSFMWVNQ